MSKVQCTFRLPQQVVEFIDGQVGKDRTEKLLYLLGYEPELPEHIVMHGVMHRLDELEKRISQLESNGKVSSGKSTNRSANEDRRLSAIERIIAGTFQHSSIHTFPSGKATIQWQHCMILV